MASESQGATKRIELEDGGWVDVRRTNAGVVREVAIAAHERGAQSDVLDTLEGLSMLVVARQGGDVDQEFLDGLTERDLARILRVAKGTALPNRWAPSFAGMRRKALATTSGRSNG